MLKICLVFWKSEPQYAYKYYAYKKHVIEEKERERKRQITEMNMTLGKYGR